MSTDREADVIYQDVINPAPILSVFDKLID